jgi:hypothetical protein
MIREMEECKYLAQFLLALLKQLLDFDYLLLIMGPCFLPFSLWRHSKPLSMLFRTKFCSKLIMLKIIPNILIFAEFLRFISWFFSAINLRASSSWMNVLSSLCGKGSWLIAKFSWLISTICWFWNSFSFFQLASISYKPLNSKLSHLLVIQNYPHFSDHYCWWD